MAKRGATSDLNHDNWDREEEREEAGTFSRASEEQIKTRTIKTARRRNPISSNGDGDKKGSAFSGFSGFGKTSTPTTPNFNFLSNLSKTNGTIEKDTPKSDKSDTPSFSIPSVEGKEGVKKPDEYFAKLKGLNESVAKWITKHVNENPMIDLEPVFKDYRKYFDQLEKDRKNKENAPQDNGTKPPEDESTNQSENKAPLFSFAPANPASTASNFSFGSSTAKPTFTFGSANNAPTTKSGSENFSFASTVSTASSTNLSFGTPTFNFGNAIKPAEKKDEEPDKNGVNDDEDEPPKVEYNPVMEEDHIYTIKCKLFIKKDGKFGSGSVGNLFLKNVKDSDKVQLIVRADTNLGNVLCNLILSESIPTQRLGNKDVMLVCLPLPDSKPPPTTVLLRVKTAEDADNLLETLQKHKK